MKEKANRIIGWEGRMISGSKSGYCRNNPDNLAVFNANLVVDMDPPTKIWYGDLDLTLDLPKLLELSREIGLDVLVLWEWDGRFENEEKPRVDSSVLRVRPDGTHKLGKRLTDLIHEETLTRKKG
jgi:hypothetical protein